MNQELSDLLNDLWGITPTADEMAELQAFLNKQLDHILKKDEDYNLVLGSSPKGRWHIHDGILVGFQEGYQYAYQRLRNQLNQ